MRLELVAIAPNKKSDPFYVELSWNGEWNDGSDEMSRHLVIKAVGTIE
jgi:hypothetical protein